MKKIHQMKNQMKIETIFRLPLLSLLLLVFCGQLLQAQTTWIGGTGTNWTTDANWNTNMEPTASDDVIIPTGFTVVINTNVSAQSISTSGNLSITSDGILNIDGSSVAGLKNDGTLINGGTINVGLNSPVLLNGIVNEATGIFINNGDIFTEEVGVGGTQVILSKGDFTNNGNIDIGDEHHPGAFPILVIEGSLFTNNNSINIENINPFATGKLRVQQAGSELINNGIIDMNTTGLFVSDGGTLTNSACAEILETRASIQVNGTIDNFGLMTMVAFHPNGGDWNNFGTIQSVQTQLINSGNPVSNDDLIILPLTLTNNCGVLSDVFGIGSNLGSTVSIYTDAGATMSAGAYDSGTNTFTPNFALSNTTYNLYVKVEDDANTCVDYVLPWDLTVVTAPCCNLTTWTGSASTDWDDANNWDTYLVPTACNDVIIPNGASNQPTIGGMTTAVAKSVDVKSSASLIIDGSLSIDGSTGTNHGMYCRGSVTNNGTINIGLNSLVDATGIVVTSSFINYGSIYTDQISASVLLQQGAGSFQNNGLIEVGAGANAAGIVILNGTFTNDATINTFNNIGASFTVVGSGSELLNNSVITDNAAAVFLGSEGTFTNSACAEYYGSGFNLSNSFALPTLNNFGLMSLSGNTTNNGIWNNMGTIHSLNNTVIFTGDPVNNDDLMILGNTLTNNCGELNPTFGVGANLGSTVSIYTDAGATMSAGAYDSGTNTFTPNFALSNTTYNLFVKVQDVVNGCDEYILPWNLTVVTAPCCNLTTWTGTASTDWDDANNWDTYLVPTACNDVSVPASTNQPSIGGTTTAEAASVTVAANATLNIIIGGALNLETDGIDNFGIITNSGFINVGLTTTVPVPNAISNYPTGSFTNNGTITTGQVATTGGGINIQTFGPFENNGSIVIGPGWGIVGDFGIGVYNNGLLTNNGTIENTSGSNGAFLLMQGSPAEILNNGVIDLNTAGVRLSFDGTLTNAACGEILEAGFNNNTGSIYNNGLISVIGTSNNNGLWNNLGTIHSPVSNVATPNAINNQDLIIKPNTLTNNCGELSPAFEVGSNLGSTVSIFTDAAATMSAGAYDSGTNIFTPNFALSNTTYNLYVKVVDDNGCDPYILTWDVTVIACTDTDGDTICDSCDPDDDNDGVLDGDDSAPLDNFICQDLDGDGCDDCSSGTADANNDGTDTDGDGLCDLGDPDDDNDGVLDGDDSAPLDNFICQDLDGDGCDDCSSGTADVNNDGTDTDGDGLCDLGDPDDDNDGQTDVDEIACGSDPLDDLSTSLDSDADNSPDCVDPTLSVCDAIDALEAYILTLGLPNNTEGFLLNKLGKAKTKYNQGNNNAAIGNLGAFINKVNAKSPSQISPSEAATLIAIANAIIDAINNGNTNCTNSEGFVAPNTGNTISPDLGFESLDIYPNPATNMVNIKMQDVKLNTQVFIYDNLGRVVFQQDLDQDQTILEVDLSGNRFQAGVYIVSVVSGEYTNAKRLVISK